MTEENISRDKCEPDPWNPEDEHLIKPIEDLPTPAFEQDEPLAQVFSEFVEHHMEAQRVHIMYNRIGFGRENVDRKSVAQEFFDEQMFKAVDAIEEHNGLGASTRGTWIDTAQAWARMVGLLEFAIFEGLFHRPYTESHGVPRTQDGSPDFRLMETMSRYRNR